MSWGRWWGTLLGHPSRKWVRAWDSGWAFVSDWQWYFSWLLCCCCLSLDKTKALHCTFWLCESAWVYRDQSNSQMPFEVPSAGVSTRPRKNKAMSLSFAIDRFQKIVAFLFWAVPCCADSDRNRTIAAAIRDRQKLKLKLELSVSVISLTVSSIHSDKSGAERPT